MKKLNSTIILSFLLIFCTTTCFAQITENEINSNKKYHYILHNVKDIDSKKIYTTALSKLNLDEYRLIKKRRIIKFNTDVTVELLSGEELFEKYQKRISPVNLKKEIPIVFIITLNGATITVKKS